MAQPISKRVVRGRIRHSGISPTKLGGEANPQAYVLPYFKAGTTDVDVWFVLGKDGSIIAQETDYDIAYAKALLHWK